MKRLLFLLLAAPSALGWVNIGPSAGSVTAFTSDPRSGALFAANARSGIYRTSDDGATWTLVFDTVARQTFVYAVAADPQTSRVYAGIADALLRSDDSGLTWTTVRAGYVAAVTAFGDRVVVSGASGLELSTDAGATWKSIPLPPVTSAVPAPTLVRIDPREPSTLYVSLGGTLFRTRNDGASWEPMTPSGIASLAFGDSLYAGGSLGVWRCSDACTLIDEDPVLDLAVWRGTLYGADLAGVVRFVDAARERVSDGLPEVHVDALAATAAHLVAATEPGVFRSDDGTRWTVAAQGMATTRVSSMAMRDGALFVALEGAGVQRFAGGDWKRAEEGLPNGAGGVPNVRALAADGASLYAAMEVGQSLYRSDDGGTSWRWVGKTLPSGDVRAVAADGGYVYVTTESGMYFSPDGGTTWSSNIVFDPPDRIAAGSGIVAVSFAQTIEVSRDHGTSAVVTHQPSAITALAIAAPRVYAGTATTGVFYTDDGRNWIDAGVPQTIVRALATHGTRVYAALEPVDSEAADRVAGIYSTDDGAHWTLVAESDTLPRDIRALAADDRSLYAATNSGVFAFLPMRRRAR